MSQPPINTRPTEEALAVLLIIATLSFSSLFAVAKTAGKRLAGSALREEERVSDADDDDWKPEAMKNQEHDHHRDGIDRHSAIFIQSDHSQIQHNNKNGKNNPNSNSNHQQTLNAIHAWESATKTRIRRQRAQKLAHLAPLRDVSRQQGIQATLDWEMDTMGRFREEERRRLEGVAARTVGEQMGREAVRVWESGKVVGGN
ncbi:hypothetical protein IMSHALPRED_010356 [Imshaugia aleurites]|uniref:Uncharacterized protein n=1 Tax=Imshaugia aleurites TaxID=172621 RepID=A0A8H3G351_9LECA|nr:hypothetical protein IMSHALPRED_010356 [Imshaugia aleurites]